MDKVAAALNVPFHELFLPPEPGADPPKALPSGRLRGKTWHKLKPKPQAFENGLRKRGNLHGVTLMKELRPFVTETKQL